MSARPEPDPETGPQRLPERVVAIVEAVAAAGEPVGPRGLARLTNIDRSAVGRILQQLSELGVLERSGGGYVPGPRLFTIARLLVSLDTLPNAANAVLAGLVERFDETCYVCVRHADAAVFLYEAQSSKPLRFVVELGRPVPLYAGGAGRAILAGLSGREASDLLAATPLVPLTPNTITSRKRLLELAAADAARGYSVSHEERVEGGVAIGSPFFDETRCVGSVVFTAPVSRVADHQVAGIGAAVAEAARTLSARLGYRGS